jgi:hypothetical protein
MRELLVAQITNHKGSGLRPEINIRTRKRKLESDNLHSPTPTN